MTENRRMLVTRVENGKTVYGEIQESLGLDEIVMDVFSDGSTLAVAVQYGYRRKENDYRNIRAMTEKRNEPRFLHVFLTLSNKLMSIKKSESDSTSDFYEGKEYTMSYEGKEYTMSLVDVEKIQVDLYTHFVKIYFDK